MNSMKEFFKRVDSDDSYFGGDVNVDGKIVVDGNIVMTSPDGTQWNCGVSNLGNLECS